MYLLYWYTGTGKEDKFSTPTAWTDFHQPVAVEQHDGESFPGSDVHTLGAII
jgi:hypothetical protein